VVRIALGYIVDDYCLTFVRGRGVVRITLGYIVDDYCLTFVGEGGWFVLLLDIWWMIIA
jgi:hypothetical protein